MKKREVLKKMMKDVAMLFVAPAVIVYWVLSWPLKNRDKFFRYFKIGVSFTLFWSWKLGKTEVNAKPGERGELFWYCLLFFLDWGIFIDLVIVSFGIHCSFINPPVTYDSILRPLFIPLSLLYVGMRIAMFVFSAWYYWTKRGLTSGTDKLTSGTNNNQEQSDGDSPSDIWEPLEIPRTDEKKDFLTKPWEQKALEA